LTQSRHDALKIEGEFTWVSQNFDYGFSCLREEAMRSVIFVATIPKHQAEWEDFSSHANARVLKQPGVTRLGENVWFLEMNQSAAAFTALCATADRFGIAFSFLPLPTEVQWLQDQPQS
jgi:hypothetical protein